MRSTARIIGLVFLVGSIAAPWQSLAQASTTQTYVVIYKGSSVPADAGAVITRAGGTLVYRYGAIGVVIARSSDAYFRDTLLQDSRIENAVGTARFGRKLRDVESTKTPPGDLVNAPADPTTETFWQFQWDMAQIDVADAHAITAGSPSVVVGDIDTGLDKDHPDLIPNIDFTKSVSCESGAPVSNPDAWDDHNGHGTHTAGTIAAAVNNMGIAGVAPNVKIAGIKASIDDGFFFPEMVICAFMWAGEKKLDVTNNSYFADPFYFNCHNDPEQRAILKAEQRAIRFAMSQGVTVVAAEGNFSDDLAHPTRDVISPDFPPGSEIERDIRNNCIVIPVEVSGVIGVTAEGVRRLKSFYSNYGVGVTEVVAPGGDSILQRVNDQGGGRVLSTFPDNGVICSPARRIVDPAGGPKAVYCWLQGTSMASPHAAGVAALIISQHGKSGLPKGHMRPGAVASMLQRTADSMDCPTSAEMAQYEPFPSVNNGAPQRCQGGTGSNSFYGKGQINALKAVLGKP